MPRPRKHDRHLPPSVYLRRGAFYHVVRGVWHPLGRVLEAALAEYARRISGAKGSMPAEMQAWLDSARPRLAASTYSKYRRHVARLAKVFAAFTPEQVRPVHIAQVKKAFASTPNMANQMVSILREFFNDQLEQQLVESNPAVGIRRFKEAKRERLLTDEEIRRIVEAGGPRLRCVVEVCYLTGQRIGDVLGIRLDQFGADGIEFRQQKTGARLVVRWTPALREVVARARALHGPVPALTLFKNRRGKAPDYTTIEREWLAACRAAGVEDARLHDLRAAAATAVGKAGAGALLGHASEGNTARYLRAKIVPVVDGPQRKEGEG